MGHHISIAFAMFAVALGLLAPPLSAQPREFRVGCYVPMTGLQAQMGKSMDNGFRMAIADKAHVMPNTRVVIECKDDQGRADDGINLARKFIEDPGMLAVLGSWSSTVTLAAAPIYNQAGMVNITPVASHPDVTKVGLYVFRQSIIQSFEGPANADYMIQLGYRKVAMIGLPNDYGKVNIELTKLAFEAKGGKIVFEEFVRPDAQDFRQTIQKAVRAGPDALYLALFPQHGALVAKQVRQMGIKLPIYGAAALESPDFLRLAGDAADGIRLLMVFNPDINPDLDDFFRRYQQQFDALPEPFAINSYITASALIDVLAKLGPEPTREDIRSGWEAQREIQTIAGPITYDPETREWSFNFTPGIIEKGEFVIAH